MADLESMMRKISALLANADDPATPPAAAETYRNKAEALMFQYKIDALTAPLHNAVTRVAPIWRDIWVCRASSEWHNFYYWLAHAIVQRNLDMRCQVEWMRNEEDGHSWLVLRTVGYEGDVTYAELLVAHAIAEFGKRLEPMYDPKESDAANALRLRRGGMERRRIAMQLFGGWNTENEMKAKNRKVTTLIKQEAKRIGEPHLADELLGRSTSIATYRKSYAESFYYTLRHRITTHTQAQANEQQALVLASAKDAVDEAFYEKYPHLRPKAVIDGTSAKTADKCEKCAKAKSGYCREHAWLRPRAARQEAWSQAGARAGAHTARSVDLGAVGTKRLS